MFGSVSKQFANPRHVKDEKLKFRACMQYFGGTKVVKLPFYSIGPKMMFGTVSELFANLRQVKDENSSFGPECTILRYQVVKRPF
jgi:hypothetical protein